ncbi:MAG: hypothetical protein J6C23_04720 [Clostridia bacterium]|nr:hypothetical protein [Clostridia bacterium]
MAIKEKIVKARKYFDIIAAVLGVVAIIMMFIPAVVYKAGTEAEKVYTGLQVIFGYSETTKAGMISVTTNHFAFSFMNLLTYVLFLGGVVVLVLNMLGKSGKFGSFIALACFVVATVFAFCTVAFSVPGVNEILGNAVNAWKVEDLTLSAGPIVAAIMGILASVVCAGKILFK